MSETKTLQVMYDEKLVGTLAMASGHKVAFQYSEEWLEDGFSISPFSLPLKNQVFVPQKDYFDGLFGVFADSLPDNWGRLLLNRLLRAHKQNPDRLTVLDRLEIVGKSGMGAITYHPERTLEQTNGNTNLDELAEQCQKILNTEYSDKLDELYRLGGTSGGARPKIMTTIDEEEWIIKFPVHVDGKNAGKMEYDYSCCAKKSGITMSETRLFQSEQCDIENMFRRMCFNVFAHNRDDHSKNFTYLYDEEKDSWRLSRSCHHNVNGCSDRYFIQINMGSCQLFCGCKNKPMFNINIGA